MILVIVPLNFSTQMRDTLRHQFTHQWNLIRKKNLGKQPARLGAASNNVACPHFSLNSSNAPTD